MGKLLGSGLEKRFRARGEGRGEKVDGSCSPAGVAGDGVIPAPAGAVTEEPSAAGGGRTPPNLSWGARPIAGRQAEGRAQVIGSVCVVESPPEGRGRCPCGGARCRLVPGRCQHGEGSPFLPRSYLDFVP